MTETHHHLPLIIIYGLPHETKCNLNLYNLNGRKIFTLVDKVYPAGYHSVKLSSLSGNYSLPTGVYLITLETEGKRLTKRVVLHK